MNRVDYILDVSVIMSIYNESVNELNESVKSILNQTYSNFEFIIINDNPKSSELTRYLNSVKLKDKRIRLIFNDQNLGLIKSVNKGIKKSYGQFIVRMDADDISSKNRISKQLEFLVKNNLDLVCSNFADLYSNMKYFGDKNQFNQKKIRNIMSHCNIAIGPTILFDKDIIKQLKGYRNLFTDDYDIAARALMKGYRIGYQSNVFVYKRNRKENISNNHSLEEFVSNKIISNAIKYNDYNKIATLQYINTEIEKITEHDVNKFDEFKLNYNKLKNNRNILNILNVLKSTISSKLVFQRNLWMFFQNKKYKKMI